MRITECGFRLTDETCNSLAMNLEQRRMGVIIGVIKSDAGTFDLANEEK